MNAAAAPDESDSLVAIGIDLGGTGSRFVATDRDHTVVARATVSTPREVSAEIAVAFLVEQIGAVARGSHLRSIGIGASGPIDASGVIRNTDTLPAFSGVNLAEELTRTFAVPVAIDNDAVTAAVFEDALGVARPFASLLMITLGTGVGVSAVVHGRPVRGADGVHPEGGHLAVSGAEDAACYCGRPACWEQTASRSALQRAAGRLLNRPAAGIGDIDDLVDRADAGDQTARAIFERYGLSIAVGLSDLLTWYRPQCVVLGGGGARYHRLYRHALARGLSTIHTYATPPALLVSSELHLAGARGAALMSARSE